MGDAARPRPGQHLARGGDHLDLDAAAADRAQDPAVADHGQARARVPGRRAPGRDHRGEDDIPAVIELAEDLGQEPHARQPTTQVVVITGERPP